MKIFIKLILIGDLSVGKSSIQKRYVNNNIKSSNITIGNEFLTKELIIDGKPLTMQIWDTYGNERFKFLGPIFYRSTNCCVLSFDVTKEDSFVNLEFWKEQFEETTSPSGKTDKYDSVPLIVFANKIDLTTQRVITRERAELWCKVNGNIPYFEVSAKDAININEAFDAAAKLTLDQYIITHTDDDQSKPPLTIIPNEEPNYSTCC